MHPQKFKSTARKLLPGFTLVELIVVITILAILGTIGFISIQWYSSSARDSSRISNLVNLHKGLTIFQTVGWNYPMPESPITITASGTPIGYQGFAKDQIGNIAKLSAGSTKDPLDPTIYTTYATNALQTKMQLMAFLEDGSKVTALLETPVNAATSTSYATRSPMTKWDTLGILLGTGITLNQPVQELLTATFTGIDVVSTSTGYTAVFSLDTTVSGTGASLAIVSSMGARSCNEILLKDPNKKWKDGLYYIHTNGLGGIQVYCDMTTDGGGWTLFWSFNKNNYQLPTDALTQPLFIKNTYLSGSTYSYTDTTASKSWNIPLQNLWGTDGARFDTLATIPGTCEKYVVKGYVYSSLSGTGAMSIGRIINTHGTFSTYGYAPQYGTTNHFWHKGNVPTAWPYVYLEKQDCQFWYTAGWPSVYPDIRAWYIRFY